MPASPFGLAYGLGAGLAQVPGGIRAGENDRLVRGMQQLQLQQAKQQMEDEAATRAIMSAPEEQMPVKPFEYQVPGSVAPVGTAMDANAGPAVPADVAVDRGLAVATPPVVKKITPEFNQEMASSYDLLQRANRLQQAGQWQTAMKVRQMAEQYGENGINKLRQNLKTSVMGGDEDRAVAIMHGLGLTKVVSVKKAPDGGVIVTDSDGDVTPMSKYDFEDMVDPKVKFNDYVQMQRLKETTLAREQKLKEIQMRGDIQKDLLQMKIDNPLAFHSATKGQEPTAFIRNAEYMIKAKMETGMSYEEAKKAWQDEQGFNYKNQLKPSQEIAAINKTLENISRNDPAYQPLVDRRNSLLGVGAKPSVGTGGKPAPQERKQFKNIKTGKLEWFKKVNGNWVKE